MFWVAVTKQSVPEREANTVAATQITIRAPLGHGVGSTVPAEEWGTGREPR